MVQFADRAIRLIARVSTALAMIGMALLVILFTANIVGRVFGASIPSVDDISSIVLAAVFSLGLAAAAGNHEHLSINIFTDRLPEKVRWPLMRVVELVSVLVASYLCVGVFRLTAAAFQTNQKMLGTLPIPRYLPMGVVLVGVALFTLVLLLVFIRNTASRPQPANREN